MKALTVNEMRDINGGLYVSWTEYCPGCHKNYTVGKTFAWYLWFMRDPYRIQCRDKVQAHIIEHGLGY